VAELWFPHGPSSRVLLIGAGEFQSNDLPSIPAISPNLVALEQALTHPEHGLLTPEHCRVLADPTDGKPAIGTELNWAIQEASDLLLVYYAGHGLLDEDGWLHLALADTDPEDVSFTAVPLELIKRGLGRARAKARVLVLDCCFSGRAVAAMTQPQSAVSGQLDLTGTYTLTSTTATTPSHAPPGEQYTAFTGAFLQALAQPEPLTLDGIYHYVDRELAGLGLPRPQCRSVNAASALTLVRGPVPITASPRRSSETEELHFAKSRRAHRRQTIIGGLSLLLVLAIVVAYLFHMHGWPEVLTMIAIPVVLMWVGGGPTSYELVFSKYGLTFRDNQKGSQRGSQRQVHIPWEHISYIGVLRKDPIVPSLRRNILLVRLWPGVPPVAPLPSWLDTSKGRHYRLWGYVPICTLKDVDGDPGLIHKAVERFTRGQLFRTNRELIDLDERLLPD
jgi:hypothetical protein